MNVKRFANTSSCFPQCFKMCGGNGMTGLPDKLINGVTTYTMTAQIICILSKMLWFMENKDT